MHHLQAVWVYTKENEMEQCFQQNLIYGFD